MAKYKTKKPQESSYSPIFELRRGQTVECVHFGAFSVVDSSGKLIAWYDNIPVLSWLILRGKCRHCKKPI